MAESPVVTPPRAAGKRLGWHSLGASFECDCGVRHRLPIHACYVGVEAAERLAAHAREHGGHAGFVVADEQTLAAAGESVSRSLRDVGSDVKEHVYTDAVLDATAEKAEALRDLAAGSDFLVAIGSGTICDLVKYAGHLLERPVFLYPTAASMNGYTSGIAALKVRGLKRTLPCTPAHGIFADPAVSAAAPPRMVAAGIADYLSKCSSSTDWRAARFIRGGYYCDRPREFFEGTTEGLLRAAEGIGHGDGEAYQTVLEALMLSGFSMVLAGSSAPASGGEHLISHFLDMKSALYGTPHDLHGAQVGVATLHCLRLWESIFTSDPASIDVDALVALQPDEDDIQAAIATDWGALAGEIQEQWAKKRLSDEELRSELEKLKANFAAFVEDCNDDLLPAAVVEKAIAAAGGPVDAKELNAPLKEYDRALSQARYIRDRFTVLDLAAELGL